MTDLEKIAALEKENADLRKQLETLAADAETGKAGKADPRIRAKMAAGLSRTQAEEVLAFQDKADAEEKKAAKEKAEKK